MSKLFWFLISLFTIHSSLFAADYPGWWQTRNVITNSAPANDYAAVNAGQLKWMATNAYAELQAYVSGGAGTNVEALIASFPGTSNYVAVNVGQLKYVAQPFYDSLIEMGYTNAYPWTATTNDDASYAMVNLGQLKNVFSFNFHMDSDTDGIPDAVEIVNRTDPYNNDTNNPTVSIVAPANNSVRVLFP